MPDQGLILTIEDVTRQKEAESRVRFLADHDALTGLPNRMLMRAKVEEALTGARRGRGFAYHALDLDHFKVVNDTMGHAAGDDLLAQVAGRLRTCVKAASIVARLGGDEFAILQPDASGEDGSAAIALARRIIVALRTPFVVMGREVSIGASVGTAFAPRGRDDGRRHRDGGRSGPLPLQGKRTRCPYGFRGGDEGARRQAPRSRGGPATGARGGADRAAFPAAAGRRLDEDRWASRR